MSDPRTHVGEVGEVDGEVEDVGDVSPPRRAWWRRLIPLVLGLLLVYVVVSATGGITDALTRLGGAEAWWVVPALAAEGFRHVLLGVQLHRLRGDESMPSVRMGTLVSLVSFGLGGLMPASPTEGITMSVVELHRRSMPVRSATLTLSASQIAQFGGLVTLFAADRFIVIAGGELRHRSSGWAVVVSLLLLGFIAAGAWAMRKRATIRWLVAVTRWLPGQRHKGPEELDRLTDAWHHDLLRVLGSKPNRVIAVLLAVGSALCSAAVLWMALRAVGSPVAFEVAVLGYCVIMVVGWVPLLPSGLGVVEVAIPALLHRFGVPHADGLAAVLAWRVVSSFAPGLAGLVAYLALRATRPPSDADGSTPPTEAIGSVAG